ncbi:pullulanase, type I [Lachnospiraceae bacterium RM5]|nr:pullulanase, type I [Lachnospiraceae bacterium RM5]
MEKRKFKRTLSVFMMFAMVVSLMNGMHFAAFASAYSDLSALDAYAYSGDDLGATYSKTSTTFKVWAPTATSVKLKRYYTGSDSEAGAGVIEIRDMSYTSGNGIWSVTVSGDLKGTYYTYLVTANGTTKETVDIYAKSTGVNGLRGMVIDLDSTDPSGWENDKRVDCDNQTDAIIWEAHVRDFSSSSDSGMTNKGKFLAFTEIGTTVNSDGVHKTGIDYLEDLGITHIHLLPVYDYGSVDETKLNTDQFNWGYDPLNYNTPEGSYSTNPYDGNVRVNEYKQMVKSLHDKNIGVVMDVVYNHTYAGDSGINDWFNFTVPGYYYRQNADGTLANASGCGNETASDRAMYQKYMVDSVVYWAKEYHIDGFRFDLMGIHDVDTMNKIREELDKIDPDILIYGEPWSSGDVACPKLTAVQGNMSYVSEEVAAFNDKMRDAIKGSCFNAADKGFIQGATGFETALKGSIQANSTEMSNSNKWSKCPSQTITYTSAHDNYSLYDKLVKSVKGGYGYTTRYDDLVAMNKMAGGIILTSQGIPFFQAGEEFARSKNGNENSYNASTETNQLKWINTVTYSDIVSYYKGLIEIRKAYEPFRDPTNTSNNTIYFSWGSSCPSNVVAFTMYNKLSNDGWNFAAVVHNSNSTAKTVSLMTYDGVTLPSQWVIVADGTNAGIESLGTSSSTVTVPARSTMVLIDKTSFDNTVISDKCKVTVNHIIENTGNVYKTETLKGNEGSSYTTSPLSELTNLGYYVTKTTGNTSSVFSTTDQVVNYYYKTDKEPIKRIYFDNTAGWSDVYVYVWNNTTKEYVSAWPGTKISKGEDGYYYTDVDILSGYDSIIFNNGSGTQTGDLTIPTNDNNLYTYSSSSWSAYKPVVKELNAPVAYATSNSSKSVVVSWDAVEGATSYQLYKYFPSTGTIQTSKVVTDTTATFNGLTAGKTYRYIVQAVSDTAVSNNVSKEFAVDAMVGKKINTSVVPKASYDYSKGCLTLSWDKVSGVSKYYVYKYYLKTKTLSAPKEVSKNYATYYTAEPGKTYRYLVSTKKFSDSELSGYNGKDCISVNIPEIN